MRVAWAGHPNCIGPCLADLLELRARQPHDWQRLFKEVSRDRRAALRQWRREGLAILSRVRMQETLGPDVRLPSTLAEEFQFPGKGMRSLKGT